MDTKNLMEEHPEKVQVDTVVIDGEKQISKVLRGRGIDLPGTFVAIGVSKSGADDFSFFVRETSLGQWRKVGGIVPATVSLTNQSNSTP
jgi:hypothetical protein